MGAEFKAKGAHVALGPVAGPLGRSAYGSRNWEGFSPDPYLTGAAMEETIIAMQKNGVQANAKREYQRYDVKHRLTCLQTGLAMNRRRTEIPQRLQTK